MCGQCVEWGGVRWHRYGGGYYERTVKADGRRWGERLHRAVWEAERGPIPSGWDVHHKDDDKANNSIGNLDLLPHADHLRIHGRRNVGPFNDWSVVPQVEVACTDCGSPVRRQKDFDKAVCIKCQSKRARERQKTEKSCANCGGYFRSFRGNYCSQRCVNLATRGGTRSVLPHRGGAT